ncbi:MAG: ATP-binding protein [Microscillaceae bacterium]|nr:ATP-binding protein [Microscillaceae bacterium]
MNPKVSIRRIPTQSIRAKLLLAFSIFALIITLIIGASIWFYAYNQRIDRLLIKLDGIEMKSLKAFLLAKDFFLYETINPKFYEKGKSTYWDEQKKLHADIRQDIKDIKELDDLKIMVNQSEMDGLSNKIIAFDQVFERLVNAIQRRGFKDYGIEGEMRDLIHEVESYQDRLNLGSILTIRRHEKDFIIRKQEDYVSKLAQAADRLKSEIKTSILTDSLKSRLLKITDLYTATFRQMVKTEKEIGFQANQGLKGELGNLSLEIDRSINQIGSQVSAQTQKIRNRVRLMMLLLFLISFVVVTVAGYYTAHQLGKPIKELSESIYRIIASNFEGNVVIPQTDTKDEVGGLARDFSVMYQKLKEHNEEIMQQSEEIASQRDQLEKQNQQIRHARQIAEEANEELSALNTNLEKIVQERTQKLTKTNEELDLFIYRASHDLKGPLARLAGLALLGNMECEEAVAREYFDKFQRNTEEMDGLLNKLLMIHVINQEIRRYRKVVFQDVWDEAETALQTLIRRTGGQVEFQNEYPQPFFSDKQLLILIVQNLVENALLYQKKEENTVFPVRLSFQNDRKHEKFIIQVEDHGIGIESLYKDKIFDMFFRGTELSQGNGLGLYIVRKAVDGLEGQILVESQVDAFTRITVVLPHRSTRKKILDYN